MSALGPGCVKTCTSRECAELFSLFSSFDGDCQSGSSVIQCNRDKPSTLKFDIGVFTQPGSTTDSCTAAKLIVDHLDGLREQRERHGEAERLGCLKVDHQIEFCRLLNRQIHRLGAL
jgi:hypothetical protein